MLSAERDDFVKPGEYRFYYSKSNNRRAFFWSLFVILWDIVIFWLSPLRIFLQESPVTAFKTLWYSPDKGCIFLLMVSILFTALVPFGLTAGLVKRAPLIITPGFLQVWKKKYRWDEIVAAKKAFLGYHKGIGSVPETPVLIIETTSPQRNPYSQMMLNAILREQLGSLNSDNCIVLHMYPFSQQDRRKILSLIDEHIKVQKSELLLQAKEQGIPNGELRGMGDFDDDDFV